MSITITLEATRLKCQSCDFLFTDDSPADVKARFDPAYYLDILVANVQGTVTLTPHD